MKKISVAFDGLKFSTVSMAYAIEAALKSKALLSGIFLDDFVYHSSDVYDMVGSRGISGPEISQLMKEDSDSRDHAVVTFEAMCQKAELKYNIHRDKSFALQELLKESIYSDLLYINTVETFTHFIEHEPTHFLTNLLADVQCPVVITPREYRAINKVILLYDGKPSSVFAIKMFNYLMPWLKETPTEIVTVVEPHELNLPNEPLIREFITCHYPSATYTLLHGSAKKEVTGYLKETDLKGLVVCGAYQRSAVSMWFKSSMANVLMKEVDMPLFIAHNK